MLNKELKFYASQHKKWLKKYPGQFILIKNDELVDAFATHDEAFLEGVRLYGNAAFLIRRVEESEKEEVFIPALALNLIHADTAHAFYGRPCVLQSASTMRLHPWKRHYERLHPVL